MSWNARSGRYGSWSALPLATSFNRKESCGSIAYFLCLYALRPGIRVLKRGFHPAERDQIAGLEGALLDRLAIDESAIARAQIGQPDLLLAVAKPGVLPRDA